MRTYWHRQPPDKPLFPQLEWSRPETKQTAGKLLIVGGHLYNFAAPAQSYAEAGKAGIGTVRVLLPDSLQKTVGAVLEEGEFASSTPGSGSFSQQALGALLDASQWADGVLCAGDLGRNAQTAILLEKFLHTYKGQVTLTKDAADYAASTPAIVLDRPHTLLIVSLAQLQRLGTAAQFEHPVTFSMDLLHLIDWLHTFTARFAPFVIVMHLNTLFVAADGQVSTTKLDAPISVWRLRTATHASVWWLQHPNKPFEALTNAIVHVR